MRELLDADPDFTLWSFLFRTRDAMHRARGKELEPLGISVREAIVLFLVQVLGGKASLSEIARWLFREPHTLSGLTMRMQKAGLIRKAKDLEKRNLVRVELTEKGQQVYKEVAKRLVIHRIMASLSEEERQQLRSCLEKLRDKALAELEIDSKPLWP